MQCFIPGCGFACSRCIEEIEARLTAVEGVSNAYIADEGGEQRLVVEHDSDKAPAEKLVDILETLPSFLEGFFKATPIRK